MKMKDLRNSLALFPGDADVTLHYVPNCFPFSGAPDHPSVLYMSVELTDTYFSDKTTCDLLRSKGWRPEDNDDDAEFWTMCL